MLSAFCYVSVIASVSRKGKKHKFNQAATENTTKHRSLVEMEVSSIIKGWCLVVN